MEERGFMFYEGGSVSLKWEITMTWGEILRAIWRHHKAIKTKEYVAHEGAQKFMEAYFGQARPQMPDDDPTYQVYPPIPKS
jgi:hypothetical protein